ncbi:hypothetical protein [Labrys monachus]|uniref:Uncharacterized protein n=1 Tax=Labrys monachus TaxID=217067 RepID=A0ABU0FAB9_9HYPH|nr:hypothetical protein [Labrys monachus]MDQ0391571.1 hypothetical protein [Labrys monachus]
MLRPASVLVFAGAILTATPVLANDFCDKELKPLIDNRLAITASINAISKNPKKSGAREAFCSRIKAYISADEKIIDYMRKNKDFCAIPDQTIAQFIKDVGTAGKTHKKVCMGPPPQARPRPGGPPALPKPPVELRLE